MADTSGLSMVAREPAGKQKKKRRRLEREERESPLEGGW